MPARACGFLVGLKVEDHFGEFAGPLYGRVGVHDCVLMSFENSYVRALLRRLVASADFVDAKAAHNPGHHAASFVRNCDAQRRMLSDQPDDRVENEVRSRGAR